MRLVVNPRASRISVRIDPRSREAVVVAPSHRARQDAAAFAQSKSAWIAQALARLSPARPFVEGGLIPIRGVDHVLTRSADRGRPRLMAAEGGEAPRLDAPGPADAFAGRVRRALLGLAREDLEAASEAFADQIERPIARIVIRDTGSRWGSCTAAGVLNYSWRLIAAPPSVLRYVAAHEVAHLVHHNHGPRFWALVRQLQGDPEPGRAWLKANGAKLFAIGAEA